MRSILVCLAAFFFAVQSQSELDNTAQFAAASLQAAEHNALSDVEVWLKEAKMKVAGVMDKAGSELKQIAATTGEFVQGKAGKIGQQIEKMVYNNNHTFENGHNENNSTDSHITVKFQQ